ncbi:MAG: sulfatase-like hydrolase/transferase, partial [Gemmobacter sp.]|nr:sulfatase-like hydrolase/transferase [Gemmobacter sp.]
MIRVLRTPAVRLGLAAVILFLLLVQPNHPGAMTWGALTMFPLELPAVLLALAAFGPGRAGAALRLVITAVLVPVVVLKTADFAMFLALSRGFNPVADLPLIEAGLRLMSGTVGLIPTILGACAAIALIGLIAWLAWWATGAWTAAPLFSRVGRGLGAAGALVFAGLTVADVGQARGWDRAFDPPGTAFTARVGVERAQMVRNTLADLEMFRAAALSDPHADATGLLDRIDRDVVIVFIESYGRTSLDTPLFADLHRATLAKGQTRLAKRGLAMASGYLASPTRGGQSWLAHSTFANGLWINDQIRYRASLVSGRQSLFHLAARSGFQTAAVMPQITLNWPEAAFMGFDNVFASKDLGYRGQPFNWVTMPDQFTFAALDRLVRDTPSDRPRFVQIATGSSHAPWVPVPRMVDWDQIGDGQIFNEMAAQGDTPDVVWRDHDRVRAQYRLAIDYALQVVLSYAERHADDPPLIIILGDHQAAGFVALDERM